MNFKIMARESLLDKVITFVIDEADEHHYIIYYTIGDGNKVERKVSHSLETASKIMFEAMVEHYYEKPVEEISDNMIPKDIENLSKMLEENEKKFGEKK